MVGSGILFEMEGELLEPVLIEDTYDIKIGR